MTPERWQQIEKIYHSALKLEESRRVAFLESACAGDEALRQEVESLLRFIEEPALEVAAKIFAQETSQSLLGQQIGSLHFRGRGHQWICLCDGRWNCHFHLFDHCQCQHFVGHVVQLPRQKENLGEGLT